MKTTILTDIEGTTSSISFVKDVLFPYARAALPEFIHKHGKDQEVRGWLDQVAAEAAGVSGVCNDQTLIKVLQEWIDNDRKHPALKALQGIIWEEGYRSHKYTAHIYPDAVAALQKWHTAGHALFVYSSGSITAQKLLFEHTIAGDLRHLFSGYFDTAIGNKREPKSYQAIVNALNVSANEVLFLSDVIEELDAARDRGLRTILLDRPEDYPKSRPLETIHEHQRVVSFADITL